MKRLNFLKVHFIIILLIYGSKIMATETIIEKAGTDIDKISDDYAKVYRDNKDTICEKQHGKMKCFPQKVKHEAQNLSDKTQTKAVEIKNKID